MRLYRVATAGGEPSALLDRSAELVRDFSRAVHQSHLSARKATAVATAAATHDLLGAQRPSLVQSSADATSGEQEAINGEVKEEAASRYVGTAFRTLSQAASAPRGAPAEAYIDAARYEPMGSHATPSPSTSPEGSIKGSVGVHAHALFDKESGDADALRRRIAARGF